jgi:hypothetical protein
MSTLTSLVKSGKRWIAKTRTGSTIDSKAASGLPDAEGPQELTRPHDDVLGVSNVTTLGLPDKSESHDPMRPPG